MIRRILYSFHRFTGTLLCIFFVVWFLSGFVMIFHNFPKATPTDNYKSLNRIEYNELSIDSLLMLMPVAPIKSLNLKYTTKPFLEIGINDTIYRLSNKGYGIHKINVQEAIDYAKRLNSSSIVKIDTITSLDRWLPYDKSKKEFPAYKFFFDDSLKHQLYVSSRTGECIQYTNSETRFWAWVGAIPHWLYIFNLRHYTDIWKQFVIYISGLGAIMCLAGIIIGFISFYKRFRVQRKIKSPYKKKLYKWHHVGGFIFGIFIFTFAFSGMMSLQKVPQWIVKTEKPKLLNLNETISFKNLNLADFRLNYKKIFEKYPQSIKSIQWNYFGELPFYKVVVGDSMIYIDARSNEINPLYIMEDDLRNCLSRTHEEKMTFSLLNEYDNYYITSKKTFKLPVYKLEVNDKDKSLYYVNPKTADIRYLNKSMKARKWVYQALHSFSIKPLLENPLSWTLLMWTTMIGGTIVSLTGLWLGLKFCKRKLSRKKNRLF